MKLLNKKVLQKNYLISLERELLIKVNLNDLLLSTGELNVVKSGKNILS